MREKSGVDGLDKILQGGFPENSVVMLIGPPGMGKSTFVMNFVYTGLKKGEKCIFITTSESPEVIKKKMSVCGFDVSKYEKNLIFVDCYSWRVDKEPEKYGVDSLTDLTALSVEIKKAVDDNKFKSGRIVLDSFSDFLMYGEEKSVFKFAQIVTGEIKNLGSVGIVVLEEGLHPKPQVTAINYIADGLIRMSIKRGKRLLRIERMKQTKHPMEWVEFQIRGGVELSVREFFE